MFSATIRVNERGSLTLPMELRKKMGLQRGGAVMAEESAGGMILLRPAVSFPIEMYSESRVAEFDKSDADLRKYLKNRGRVA